MARYTGGFGSGLASGLTQVLGYGQQQRANKLARDRFDLDERKFDEQVRQYDEQYKLQQDTYKIDRDTNKRAQDLHPGALEAQGLDNIGKELDNNRKQIDFTMESNDTWIGNASAGDEQTAWITPDDPTRLNRENSLRNTIAGGRENDFLILDTFNRDPHLPEGFEYDRIVRKDGSLAISGTYTSGPKKGQKGVLTEDGGIGDDAQIAALSPEMVVGLMDGEYTTNIRGASEGGKSSWVVQYKVANYVAQGMGQRAAETRAVDEVNTDTATATLQTQVQGEVDLAAVDPETGEKDVRMSRSFRSILASAETDTEKLGMLIDQAETMGIEVPDILRTAYRAPPNGQPAPSTERQLGTSSGAMGQAPIETDTPPSRYQRLQHGLPTRYRPAVFEKKVAEQKAILENNDLDTEEGRRAQDTLDALMQQKYGQGSLVDVATSPEATQAAEQLQNGIFAGLDAMSPEEIEQKVTSGELQTTPQDEANLATVLKEAEIESAADIPVKLPPEAQIAAYTWLMTIAPDANARENIRKELHNVRTSGRIDASRFDLEKQSIERFNAESSRLNSRISQYNAQTSRGTLNKNWASLRRDLASDRFDVYEAASEDVAEVFKDYDASLYGLDSEGKPTNEIEFDETRFAKGTDKALNALRRKMNAAKGIGNKAMAAQFRSATNSVFSVALQAMAASEEYGPTSAILPDGAIDFFDTGDKFLERVIIVERDDKGPITFGIKDLGSGLKVEETIPAADVKRIFGKQGYADFRRELTNRDREISAASAASTD